MSESENKNYQSAEGLCDDLAEFCESVSLSESGLREIIERYGLTAKIDDTANSSTLRAAMNQSTRELFDAFSNIFLMLLLLLINMGAHRSTTHA